MLGVAACSPTSSTSSSGPGSPPAATASLSDLAFQFAAADGRPARKSVYLAPLQQLQRRCAPGDVASVGTAVETLAIGLASDRLAGAPRAAAAAVLAADAGRATDCYRLARSIRSELDRRSAPPRRVWRGQTVYRRYAPTLTSDLALASLIRSLLPGKVHVAYSLHAAQCQQVIYMGRKLAERIGSTYLGAFVELASGRGVGKTRYDASRVDRARVSLLGAIGGEPCT